MADTAAMPPAPVAASRVRVARLRLAAQRIGAADQSAPAETVHRMLALQGQDLPGTRWAVGLRGLGATETAVDAAFDSGALVRSWPLRGTLHVVAAEDLRWMLELSSARALASASGRRAVLGITAADVERARDVAVGALAGRRTLTRAELLATLEAGGVGTGGQRGYHLLWFLAQTGTLVMGPTRAGQQAFVLLDEWVPATRRLERDEALGELAVRYFRGHGPATVRDLARWSGLTVGDVRRGLEVRGRDVATLELDGARYHLAPEAASLPGPARRAHLLPGFDEYLLGYADRSAALAPEHSEAIVPGGNGMFKPTIVFDGRVVGTWGRTLRSGGVVVDAAPFDRLRPAVVEAIEEAAAAYGAFLGRPARLREGAAAGPA
jgi:DNA glycosylase AlkZ-like